MNATNRVLAFGPRAMLLAIGTLAMSLLGAWYTVGRAFDEEPRPPGPVAGVPILDEQVLSGELTIKAVTASAFMTTVEATLTINDSLQEGDTILIPDDALEAIGFADERVVSVSRSGPDSFAVVVQGDRLQPLPLVALTVTHFLLVPAAEPELATRTGPWVAVASVNPEDVPEATGVVLPEPPTVDTGAALTYVLDELAVDGSATRIEYHLEGDLAGVNLLPGSPVDPSAIPSLETLDGVYSGVVVIPFVPADGILRFPQAYRQHGLDLEVSLLVGSAGPETVVTPHGQMTATLHVDEAGTFHVELVGREVLALLTPGSSDGVVVVDNLGNSYRPSEGGASTPSSGTDGRPARAVVSFAGPLADGVSGLVLRLPSYEQLILGNWEVNVPPPGP